MQNPPPANSLTAGDSFPSPSHLCFLLASRFTIWPKSPKTSCSLPPRTVAIPPLCIMTGLFPLRSQYREIELTPQPKHVPFLPLAPPLRGMTSALFPFLYASLPQREAQSSAAFAPLPLFLALCLSLSHPLCPFSQSLTIKISLFLAFYHSKKKIKTKPVLQNLLISFICICNLSILIYLYSTEICCIEMGGPLRD